MILAKIETGYVHIDIFKIYIYWQINKTETWKSKLVCDAMGILQVSRTTDQVFVESWRIIVGNWHVKDTLNLKKT